MAPDDAALVALEHTVNEVCLFEWPSSSANGVHEPLGIGEATEAEARQGLAAAEEADLRHQLQAAQAEARQGLAAAAAAEAASTVHRENAAGLAAEAARAQDEAVAVVRAEMDEMEARLTDAAAKALVARTEAVAEEAQARRSSVDLDDLVAYTDLVHANTGLAADTIVVEADSSAATLSDMVEAARVAQEKAVAEAVAATRAENAAQAQAQGAGASLLAQGQLDWAQEQLETLEADLARAESKARSPPPSPPPPTPLPPSHHALLALPPAASLHRTPHAARLAALGTPHSSPPCKCQAEELRAESEAAVAAAVEERRQHRLALQDAEKELQLVRAGAASAVAAAEKALLEARREAAREAAISWR